MSSKQRILIQLDTDPRPSSFDAVVAVDAGAQVILPYGGVELGDVRNIIYGAIFTRGPDSLRSTAVFVGGSDVGLGEQILAAARNTFLGPLRVSLMLDSGGANTTAAAAVLAARDDLTRQGASLSGARALVLGATGPVGRRVVRLLARCGARVVAGSRAVERAEAAAREVATAVPGAEVRSAATEGSENLLRALEGIELVIAAGGPGVLLLPLEVRRRASSLRVAIDLNAVPPVGIEGVAVADSAVVHDGVSCHGAIGVGGRKMRIHRAAVASLFEANDRVLDAEEILAVGESV